MWNCGDLQITFDISQCVKLWLWLDWELCLKNWVDGHGPGYDRLQTHFSNIVLPVSLWQDCLMWHIVCRWSCSSGPSKLPPVNTATAGPCLQLDDIADTLHADDADWLHSLCSHMYSCQHLFRAAHFLPILHSKLLKRQSKTFPQTNENVVHAELSQRVDNDS